MPKLVDHVSYRKHLLARCFALFAERGSSALTMRMVAEALDVSTGTLYHYFPSKEALLQQLAEEISQQTVMDALSQAPRHASLEERLGALFRFLAEHEADLRKQFLISFDFYQHRDLYGSSVQTILEAGAERYDKGIRTYIGLPDSSLCLLLRHMINGLLIRRMFADTTVPFVEQTRPFVELFAQAARNSSRMTAEGAGRPTEADQHEER